MSDSEEKPDLQEQPVEEKPAKSPEPAEKETEEGEKNLEPVENVQEGGKVPESAEQNVDAGVANDDDEIKEAEKPAEEQKPLTPTEEVVIPKDEEQDPQSKTEEVIMPKDDETEESPVVKEDSEEPGKQDAEGALETIQIQEEEEKVETEVEKKDEEMEEVGKEQEMGDAENEEEEMQEKSVEAEAVVKDEAGDEETGDAEAQLVKDVAEELKQLDADETKVLEPSTGIQEDEIQDREKTYPEPPPLPAFREKSGIETATSRDILASFREEEQTQPLSLDWTFGFNRHVGCLDLSDPTRNLVMYASAHVAVLFDFENNVQKLLLGHANAITCMGCSSDKRWLVTGDKGENSSVIVWDSYTGIPVQSIFNVPGDRGVVGIAMSQDAKYIVTVSAEEVQTVSVWDWTGTSSEPMFSKELNGPYGVQTFVQFDTEDNEQFVTNSDGQVLFFSWANGKLQYHAPFLSDEVFNRAVGTFCQSLYQTNSKQALTATSYGNIVVWDPDRPNARNGHDNNRAHHKRALKLVRLQDRPITALTQTNGYIVTGDVTGVVRFYDSGLNLINWYNKGVEMGPIASISFKHDPEFDVEILAESKKFPADATIPAQPFIIRDFVVSTKNAEIFNIHADGSTTTCILCEHDASVHALASSPTKPWICIGSYAGLLKMWNYETKQCVVTRVFEKGNNIQCITFDNLGLQLAIGMTNGMVYILDSISLTDELPKPFRYARDAITHIAFSKDSRYLATADADLATTVFEYDATTGWRYLGRYRAHYKPIKDLIFGIALDTNLPRLLTLAEDRTLVEYDLQNSSKDDLRLLSMDRIEQSAVPNCLAWYPNVTKESFLVTANDQYKFKLYNTTTKMCRKTLLAPTYGSSVRKILPLPAGNNDPNNKGRLLAYITKYKVGLQMLPLDGNPHKSVALVGHPNGISHLSCSHDGKFLFTAGGKDSCVHMWSLSMKALEAATALGGEGLIPFYGLLEGGVDGELFVELENYFYFAQLRSQGLDTTESRQVSTVIPLEQIPFVMRALGFYPSEQEIEDMLNEVKFSEYVETGEYVAEINLSDFIKLYLNHRPAFGLTPDDILSAFQTLGSVSSTGECSIGKTDLYNILQRRGEHMTEQELSDYLATLIGINPEGGSTDIGSDSGDDSVQSFLESALPEHITASMFTEDILGLPVYDSQQ